MIQDTDYSFENRITVSMSNAPLVKSFNPVPSIGWSRLVDVYMCAFFYRYDKSAFGLGLLVFVCLFSLNLGFSFLW